MNIETMKNIISRRLSRFTNVATSFEAYIEAEIQAAQERLETGPLLFDFLKTRTTSIATVASTQTVTLPSDYLRLRPIEDAPVRITVDTKTVRLGKFSYEHLHELYGDTEGTPRAYAQEGDKLYLFPTPDAVYALNIAYYKSDVTLEEGTTETNLWTRFAPEYLMAETGVVMSMGYLRNKEAAVLFGGMRQEARQNAIHANIAREEAGEGTPEN